MVEQWITLSTLLFNMLLEKLIRGNQVNIVDHWLYKSHQVVRYADAGNNARNKKDMKGTMEQIALYEVVEIVSRLDIKVRLVKWNKCTVIQKNENKNV